MKLRWISRRLRRGTTWQTLTCFQLVEGSGLKPVSCCHGVGQ